MMNRLMRRFPRRLPVNKIISDCPRMLRYKRRKHQVREFKEYDPVYNTKPKTPVNTYRPPRRMTGKRVYVPE